MGVSACICSLGPEQSICVPRHVCVGGRVGVKVVRVQLGTVQRFHTDGRKSSPEVSACPGCEGCTCSRCTRLYQTCLVYLLSVSVALLVTPSDNNTPTDTESRVHGGADVLDRTEPTIKLFYELCHQLGRLILPSCTNIRRCHRHQGGQENKREQTRVFACSHASPVFIGSWLMCVLTER